MHISFAENQWEDSGLVKAYTFRYTQTPDAHQGEGHIYSDVNPNHPEGFDNISFLTPDTCRAGVTARLSCAFEGLGCPEIILVPRAEACPDGAVRYGACFEVVLYRGGINVWRHYRENGECSWHRRLGLEQPVTENTVHQLQVQVLEKELAISLDGMTVTLRTEDIPESFHLGITLCEGVARAYEFSVS